MGIPDVRRIITRQMPHGYWVGYETRFYIWDYQYLTRTRPIYILPKNTPFL
ncbi:hypothetical protein Hdeb2414_s0003g00091251 [Helianthus debilis subsp. tardiflorus]